jgi:hypothetical protein
MTRKSACIQQWLLVPERVPGAGHAVKQVTSAMSKNPSAGAAPDSTSYAKATE